MIKRTKFILLMVLLFQSTLGFSQYTYLHFAELYIVNRINARTEAMGKACVANDDDISNVIANPAGIANIKGVEFKADFALPSPVFKYFKTMNFSAGINLHKYFQIAFSMFHFNTGKTNFINTISKPYTNRYTTSISSKPVKNLYLGASVNLLEWNFGIEKKASYDLFYDFGIIKKVEFKNANFLNIAACISNFTNTKVNKTVNEKPYIIHLPIVAKLGVNYKFSFQAFKRKTNVMFVSEYQNFLNSDYLTAYRFGLEIEHFKNVFFRCGFYNENHFDFLQPQHNKSELNIFTYGMGLKIPFDELINKPYILSIDCTINQFPNHLQVKEYFKYFYSVSARFNYIFKHKKDDKK